ERSNRLANHLRRKGVGPEVRVGILARRSLEMVVGLLGILKAGGAYVPLDPLYPARRLALMLDDADLGTGVGARPFPEAMAGRTLVRLDAERAEIARESPARPSSGAGPESLAYVMYTSGSTGTPKGVCVEHRAIVRLVRGADYARFAPDEVFLQLAPLA